MEIYILQALSVLFAWALARLQGPTIDHIEHAGGPPRVWVALHKYGVWLKFIFITGGAAAVLAIGWHRYPQPFPFWKSLISGLLAFSWIYLIFDIVLNLTRTMIKRPWYYIGTNDNNGKLLKKWFGENAGKVKAYICAGMVIILNVLNLLFL